MIDTSPEVTTWPVVRVELAAHRPANYWHLWLRWTRRYGATTRVQREA